MEPRGALSDYLAAERTLLAWIRTGLALMGFGFVVARFGLFLQQLQLLQHSPSPPTYGLSRPVIVVWDSADRGWSVRERLCGLAPHAPGPAVGAGRSVSVPAVDASCGHRILSRPGWSSHGHLSDYCPRFRAFSARKQQGDIYGDPRGKRNHRQAYSAFSQRSRGEAEGHPASQGSYPVYAGGPQRRSGKGGNEDAADQASDLWQPKSRHATDAGVTQQRHRPAAEDSGLGRRGRKSLDQLQQSGLSAGEA